MVNSVIRLRYKVDLLQIQLCEDKQFNYANIDVSDVNRRLLSSQGIF